jgi:phenylacetate-coenzyme A ligase PaaK-like adenylate-forming protein
MMERKDIAALAERVFADLLAHPPLDVENYSIRMTSGTTGGGPFLTIWEEKDSSGLASGAQRFVIAFGPRAMRLSNMLFFRNDPKPGAFALAADIADMGTEDAHLFDEFAPDMIYGFPSFASRIAERMGEKASGGVATLGLSGEALSDALGDSLAKKFPNARIVMTWASAEAGVISKLPCSFLKKNQYHPRDSVRIEIADPDESGMGFLLISKTLRGSNRIEQYKTGDMARFSQEPCRCGERVTFELLGRAGYDFIKLAGAILRQEEFDRAARLCSGLFDEYRIEASQVLEGGTLRGRITLKVFLKSGTISDEAVRSIGTTFAENVFLSATQTLQDLIDKDIFLPLLVERSAEGFARGGKDLKLSLKNS